MFDYQRMVLLDESELALLIHAVGLAIDEIEAELERVPDLERRAKLRKLEVHLDEALKRS